LARDIECPATFRDATISILNLFQRRFVRVSLGCETGNSFTHGFGPIPVSRLASSARADLIYFRYRGIRSSGFLRVNLSFTPKSLD
jgi:hypothetical protein